MELNCSKCGQQIKELICIKCSDKNERKNNIIRFISSAFRYFISPIVFPLIVAALTVYLITPKPIIETEVIYNTGEPTEITSPFDISLTYDQTPWLYFKFSNTGSNGVDDLNFSITLPNEIIINSVSRDCCPKQLYDRINKTYEAGNKFSETYYAFPTDSFIKYRLELSAFPESINSIDWSITSKLKNWTKSAKISPLKRVTFISLDSNAYAQDINKCEKSSGDVFVDTESNKWVDTPNSQWKKNPTREFKDTNSRQWKDTQNREWTGKTSEDQTKIQSTKSGILISGYDPIVMTNGVFGLLQQKRVISAYDAKKIKEKVEESKDGVLFSGVNVLKFCELTINSLISKEIITNEKANQIIEKSKNSGGVLVGGYNIIVLEVEILNSLLARGIITKEEGQLIIDNSK